MEMGEFVSTAPPVLKSTSSRGLQIPGRVTQQTIRKNAYQFSIIDEKIA